MLEDSLVHRLRQAQQQDECIWTECKALETTEYDNFYLKYGLLHKDPVRELIVILSLMEDEMIDESLLCE